MYLMFLSRAAPVAWCFVVPLGGSDVLEIETKIVEIIARDCRHRRSDGGDVDRDAGSERKSSHHDCSAG
jgi:hypothetical protein